MSEKLDGVRGYWNGQSMISRHGKEISCPQWFIDRLPKDISLDGEFWIGRGSFELINGILQSSEDSIDWKRISFFVFDLPNSNEPYEVRMCDLDNLLQQTSNYIQRVDITRCRGSHQIQHYLKDIIGNGGEGMMANKPNSHYFSSMRVDSLLKVKVFYQYQSLLLTSIKVTE